MNSEFPDFERRNYIIETTPKCATAREYKVGVTEISFLLQPRHQAVWKVISQRLAKDGLTGENLYRATLREFVCAYISLNGAALYPSEDRDWRADN